MCYLLFDHILQLPHMPALGKGIGICFSRDLCQHASSTSVATSTFSMLPCFALAYMTRQDMHALMQVQACSLYIHFTTIAKVIILLVYYLKTLTGPITFSSGYGS